MKFSAGVFISLIAAALVGGGASLILGQDLVHGMAGGALCLFGLFCMGVAGELVG